MKISYCIRSSFLAYCESEIKGRKSDLVKGQKISIYLGPDGYDGQILVLIDPTNRNEFESSWESPHVSRFPARIKAAATALRNCFSFGSFEINHKNGDLTIRALPNPFLPKND
jgi:hypothetical protein